ncbi:MAG: LemA family protein [bacterium]
MENLLIWIIIVVAVMIVFWLIGTFNGLIRKRNRVDEAWSDIDVQLKRRYTLIPNLVETVKAYARHEAGTFEKVTQARNQAMQAQGLKAKAEAENMLASTLKTLFAVAENYPDLKATQNFLQLQDELSDTENKIQAARRFYNGNVRDFNTKLQVFPTNTIGSVLGFKAKDFFGLQEEAEREAPQVKF